jgi:hypothetical protein
MEKAPLRLTVEIVDINEPLRGRLLHDGSPEEPFTGWLGLLSVLQEQVRQRAQTHGASPLDEAQTGLSS